MSSPQARRGGETGVRLALPRRHTPGAPSPPAAPHPSAGKEWSHPGARLPGAVLGSAGQVRWGEGGVLRQTHPCGGGKAHPSHPPGPARAPLAAGSPSFSVSDLGSASSSAGQGRPVSSEGCGAAGSRESRRKAPHKLQTAAGQRSTRCGRSCLGPLAQDEGRAWSSRPADPHLRLPGGGGPGCPGPPSERTQTAMEPLRGVRTPITWLKR